MSAVAEMPSHSRTILDPDHDPYFRWRKAIKFVEANTKADICKYMAEISNDLLSARQAWLRNQIQRGFPNNRLLIHEANCFVRLKAVRNV